MYVISVQNLKAEPKSINGLDTLSFNSSCHLFFQAMAWCPWQPWVLATGGLTDVDGTIKIWSTSSEKLLHESTAGAQVIL